MRSVVFVALTEFLLYKIKCCEDLTSNYKFLESASQLSVFFRETALRINMKLPKIFLIKFCKKLESNTALPKKIGLNYSESSGK